ncbi:hypothetical protein D9M71_675570 [compost metagenome]
MVDHRVYAQGEQLQRRLAAFAFLFLRAERLPPLAVDRAERAAGGKADSPQAGIEPRLQQAWLTADQHAAFKGVGLERH